MVKCKGCGKEPQIHTCVILGGTNYYAKCECGMQGEPDAWQSGAMDNFAYYHEKLEGKGVL